MGHKACMRLSSADKPTSRSSTQIKGDRVAISVRNGMDAPKRHRCARVEVSAAVAHRLFVASKKYPERISASDL